MNLELKTQIEIKATPEAVWSTLTDFSEYSKWNPFIRMIKGDVRVGNQIKVGLIKMTFKPKVLVFEKNRGRMPKKYRLCFRSYFSVNAL